MWTFLWERAVETVAVGFWVAGRYSGPRDSEGAWGVDSVGILEKCWSEVLWCTRRGGEGKYCRYQLRNDQNRSIVGQRRH